jgi:O-antigen/teichoic acid export membrane protein
MLELSPGSVSIPPRMNFFLAITAWLLRNRTSARMAFLWRMVAMGLGSIVSLLWARLLVQAMGNPLMGFFQSFQALTRLGGLGDLGMSGALALKAGVMLGRREDIALRSLLASARTLFLVLAAVLCILFIGLSPLLSEGLNFESVAGSGSVTALFIYGGLSLSLMIIGGYFASLNYAHGTVTWPIIPSVLFVQILAPFFHWRLALLHTQLWIQLLPYLIAAMVSTFLGWRMLKWSHPWLGDLVPLRHDREEWKNLAATSGWAYLVGVGTVIYVATDLVVINAIKGPDLVPMYRFNYRAWELVSTLIVTASFVGLPKLTQWISSPEPADRQRLLLELKRLRVFEIVLACGAAFGYLAFNNLFIHVWLGKAYQAPLALQIAFACNLAVSVGGNAGIQMAMRAGENGLKLSGLAIGGTGLLNLTLSILSLKFIPASVGSASGVPWGIIGVAAATVIAQSISSLCLGSVTCRYLKLPMLSWFSRCWALPLGVTIGAGVLKGFFPASSITHLSVIILCYGALFWIVCRLVGMNSELLRAELRQLRALFLRS